MPEKPARKPSTLSASRAQAAARPLGSSLLVGGGASSMSGSTATHGPIHKSTRPQPKMFGLPTPTRPTAPGASSVSTGLSAGARPAIDVSASAATGSAASGSAAGGGRGVAKDSAANVRSGDRARPRGARAKATATRRADGSSESRDRWIVISVVSVFLVCVVGLMSVNMVHSSQESRAREELLASFAQAHTRQSEYRALFGRFASLDELRERGFSLSPQQAVRNWNASASHWFISIRDRKTGLVCDRTGELFDEDAAEREPVCRALN